MLTIIIICLWIAVIVFVGGFIFTGVQALPRMANEETQRRQKEKDYLANIEHYKELDMFLYEHFLRINPYRRDVYYLKPPEYRPK